MEKNIISESNKEKENMESLANQTSEKIFRLFKFPIF